MPDRCRCALRSAKIDPSLGLFDLTTVIRIAQTDGFRIGKSSEKTKQAEQVEAPDR